MGDEVHNRNAAATSLLLKCLAPAMLRSEGDPPRGNIRKPSLSSPATIISSSISRWRLQGYDSTRRMACPTARLVTAMARNGVEFGIRMSGTGARWFTAPAPLVDGLYFPGYSIADAAPDLGDSAITETAGLGGFAMAAAPAIVNFVGGTRRRCDRQHDAMGRVTLGRNSAFTLPTIGFAGTPAGIDARASSMPASCRSSTPASRIKRGRRRPDRRRHHARSARMFRSAVCIPSPQDCPARLTGDRP